MIETDTLTNQLCYSFYHVNRLFNQFYKDALSRFDLTYTQYLVLLTLWEQDGQTLKELGAQLDLASNTLTPLLKRLEDRNWILRLRPEKDRRQLIVQLTEKGRVQQASVESHLIACFQKIPGLTPYLAQSILRENQVLIRALQASAEERE